MQKNKTDWGGVASWYDEHLSGEDTYHAKVVAPNLLRVIGEVKNKRVLDIACGQGYFSEILNKAGADVTAFDMGENLIKIAKANAGKVNYFVADAEDFLKDTKERDFDIVICVLAIQNIENIKKVFENVKEILKDGGKFYLVINHPSFRIPKSSAWGEDAKEKIQYRRVDKYMSEEKIKMDMTPGRNILKEYTYSYHRPLQYYFKTITNLNMSVTRLEEWVSHRESEQGPKKEMEDKARKEFPLFMCIEITK